MKSDLNESPWNCQDYMFVGIFVVVCLNPWLLCRLAAWSLGCLLYYLVAWLLGCMVASLLGCLVAWLPALLLGCLVAWLLGCLVAWFLGCLVAWLLGCFNICFLSNEIQSFVRLLLHFVLYPINSKKRIFYFSRD